jgi:hypothetical protein
MGRPTAPEKKEDEGRCYLPLLHAAIFHKAHLVDSGAHASEMDEVTYIPLPRMPPAILIALFGSCALLRVECGQRTPDSPSTTSFGCRFCNTGGYFQACTRDYFPSGLFRE